MMIFKDFNFKLIVVEQLMYIDETLTPKFCLARSPQGERVQRHTLGVRSPARLRVPDRSEARSYFTSLEISDVLLAGVEELCMDGGNQVYQGCAPIWDGEDDLFDVASLDDLVLLPNLRRVLGSEFLGPELRDVLSTRGIVAD